MCMLLPLRLLQQVRLLVLIKLPRYFEGEFVLTKRQYVHVTSIATITSATTSTEAKGIKVKHSGNI